MGSTEVPLTATAGADGTAEVGITPYRRQTWTVHQVSIEAATAPGAAVCTVRKGNYAITPLVAQLDAAGGDPPVVLRSGERLAVQWRNLNPGDQVRVLFLYDDGV